MKPGRRGKKEGKEEEERGEGVGEEGTSDSQWS